MIIWEGLSSIDNTPCVAIATGLVGNGSANVKTGAMVQTWILKTGIDPLEAIATGADYSVCGNCPLRGFVEQLTKQQRAKRKRQHLATTNKLRACYVNVGQAPFAVWQAYHRGSYETYNPRLHAELFKGRNIRFGSYGDPVVAPFRVWSQLAKLADNWTGYTHQWRQPRFWRYRSLLMASCETIDDCQAAWSRGWRTFRTRRNENDKLDSCEIVCPASEEGGKRRTCENCTACNGQRGQLVNLADNPRKSVAIIAHGSPAVKGSYRQRFG